MHVEKLIQFLTPQRLNTLEANREKAAAGVVEAIKKGRRISGSWEEFVRAIVESKRLEGSDFWKKVECAHTFVESDTVSRE